MKKIVIYLGGNDDERQTIEGDALDVTIHPESGVLTVERVDGGNKVIVGHAPGAWQSFELTQPVAPAD